MSDHIERGVLRGSRRITLGVLLLVALAASCTDRDPATLTNPTALQSGITSTSQLVFSTPTNTVIAQPVSNFFCPAVSPFLVPMTVIVNPNGTTGVVVTQVQMQFTDSTGRTLPMVTLPGPIPITQFGDALAASRGALSFPLSLGIGCGVGTIGTVVVIVNARDGTGQTTTGQVSVNVRH